MKRKPMSKPASQSVFRNTYDNGRDKPILTRGGYRL